MAKCDTAETVRGDQCDACFLEWLKDDDDSLWLEPCAKCRVRHLQRNLVVKIEGNLCESCAAKLEQELAQKMGCSA